MLIACVTEITLWSTVHLAINVNSRSTATLQRNTATCKISGKGRLWTICRIKTFNGSDMWNHV